MIPFTPKVIVLDFDGVIVESNGIKDQAFDKIFRDYPEHHAAIMAYHVKNNAINRHQKFQHIAKEILHCTPTPELLSKWANLFREETRQAIIQCPFVAGAENFLESYHQRIPFYLASATPQDELEIIVENRKIRHYFVDIFGAPEKKTTMISKILAKESATSTQCIFVGDSPEDYTTAQQAGVLFIGRVGRSDFKKADFPVIPDLNSLGKYIFDV